MSAPSALVHGSASSITGDGDPWPRTKLTWSGQSNPAIRALLGRARSGAHELDWHVDAVARQEAVIHACRHVASPAFCGCCLLCFFFANDGARGPRMGCCRPPGRRACCPPPFHFREWQAALQVELLGLETWLTSRCAARQRRVWL